LIVEWAEVFGIFLMYRYIPVLFFEINFMAFSCFKVAKVARKVSTLSKKQVLSVWIKFLKMA